MCEVTMGELLNYANEFLNKNYGMTLDVPLIVNGRLTKTYGRFKYERNRLSGKETALSVELNKTFIIHNSKEDVFNILRHELIHYALFELGKPFDDGDSYFENELKKHNAYSQSNVVKMKSCYKKFYTYKCNCGVNRTTRNITRGSYSCRACEKNLVVLAIEKKLV